MNKAEKLSAILTCDKSNLFYVGPNHREMVMSMCLRQYWYCFHVKVNGHPDAMLVVFLFSHTNSIVLCTCECSFLCLGQHSMIGNKNWRLVAYFRPKESQLDNQEHNPLEPKLL